MENEKFQTLVISFNEKFAEHRKEIAEELAKIHVEQAKLRADLAESKGDDEKMARCRPLQPPARSSSAPASPRPLDYEPYPGASCVPCWQEVLQRLDKLARDEENLKRMINILIQKFQSQLYEHKSEISMLIRGVDNLSAEVSDLKEMSGAHAAWLEM